VVKVGQLTSLVKGPQRSIPGTSSPSGHFQNPFKQETRRGFGMKQLGGLIESLKLLGLMLGLGGAALKVLEEEIYDQGRYDIDRKEQEMVQV
jgi:hypothetical protein